VFIETLVERPPFTDALLRSVGASLSRLTTRTADLAFLDVPGRVAKLLLTLAERQTAGGRAAARHHGA
jgi:CRP-like cAMP-binding protein